MPYSSRGKEITIALTVDGALLQGSFARVKNFKISPVGDIQAQQFLGDPEDEPDYSHHGWDFSFEVDEADSQPLALYLAIAEAEIAGAARPDMSITRIVKYRDPAIAVDTKTLSGKLVLMLEGQDIGDGHGYVKNSFKGKCRSCS
jgi:hypothetical protein